METLTLQQLGKLARRLRKDAGLSQTEVADRVSGNGDVAQNHVSRAEHGDPKYASLAVRIVEQLGSADVETVYRVTLNDHLSLLDD